MILESVYTPTRESFVKRHQTYTNRMLQAVTREKIDFYRSLRDEMEVKIFALDKEYNNS